MPRKIQRKKQLRVQTFSRGQNSADEPSILKSGFAQKLENGIITQVGKVTSRKGLSRVGDNPDTLISEWNFNDSTHNDSVGTNHGTATSTTFSDGKFGKGCEFNGSTSSVVVTADSTIDVTSMGPFRVSAWVYVDSDGENDGGRIVSKGEASSVGYNVRVGNESGGTVTVGMTVYHDGATDANVVTSTTITTGAWHKIDALYNTDKSLDIYLDGALASYSTDVSGVGSLDDDSAKDLYIGNIEDGTNAFDGIIDSLRIYDGTFSAAELALDKVQGLTRFTVGTTLDRVYRVINTTLQRLDDDFKGWTDVGPGFTADLPTNFVQAKDILFILNGTDNVHSMDSAESVTDEADTNVDPPKTTVGEYMPNNRLFLAGSKTVGQRDFLWYSDTLDPQTFDRATNVIKVRSGGGGAITQIKQYRQDVLIIYKEDSIFSLSTRGATPLTDWELDVLHPNIGCKAGRTVANLGNEHIFLGDDGVRLITRTTFDKFRTGVISGPVDDIIKRINKDQLSKAVGYFHDNKYILAVPVDSATENNIVLIWDSQAAKASGDESNGWTVVAKENWFPAAFTEMEFSDELKTLVMGDNRDISLTYKVFSGKHDDGAAIDTVVEGPQHLVDNARQAVFSPLEVVVESPDDTTVEISGKIDGVAFQSLGNVPIDQGGGTDLPLDLPVNFSTSAGKVRKFLHPKKLGRGYTFSTKFRHNQYNKEVTFNEYTLWAKQIGG